MALGISGVFKNLKNHPEGFHEHLEGFQGVSWVLRMSSGLAS